MSRTGLRGLVGVLAVAALLGMAPQEKPPMRLAIAGLVHGHVGAFVRLVQKRSDVQIVGVFEPDAAAPAELRRHVSTFPKTARFTDLATMIDRTHPEAIAGFTNTRDHPVVVEAAARAPRARHDGEAACGEQRRRAADPPRRRGGRDPGAGQLRDHLVPEPRRDLDAAEGTARPPARSARWSRWTATTAPRRSTCSRSSWTGCPTRRATAAARSSISAATAPT